MRASLPDDPEPSRCRRSVSGRKVAHVLSSAKNKDANGRGAEEYEIDRDYIIQNLYRNSPVRAMIIASTPCSAIAMIGTCVLRMQLPTLLKNNPSFAIAK